MPISRRKFFTASAAGLAGASLPAALGATAVASRSAGSGPLAQDYAKIFHNPDREQYVEGCGLARLPDGAFLAVVPVVPRAEFSQRRRVGRSQLHLCRSTDGGLSWQEASTLPYYSGAPWVYQNDVYLFACEPGAKQRNDNLLLLRSRDGGKTWSEPVTLFRGHFWNCHTGMVIRDQRLYWAVDDLERGTIDKRVPRVVAGDLSGDPMTPQAWRMSPGVPFPGIPDTLFNARFAARDSRFLEPNIIDLRGQLRMLLAVKPKSQTTTSLCAVLDVKDNGQQVEARFVQYHPMPGGQLKFCIRWDEASRLFWATANLAVDGQSVADWWGTSNGHNTFRQESSGGDDRRFLMLFYGVDGLNWFQAGCIAQAKKMSQSFMYATPVIDGDDLAIISRSSVNAPNQHDADYATFHRVRNFRALALNLYPEPESP